jgi:hypothetical protein
VVLPLCEHSVRLTLTNTLIPILVWTVPRGENILVSMTPRELKVLEMENAEIRHEWAKKEMHAFRYSPTLKRFVDESLKELRILQAKVVRDSLK